MNYFIQAMSNYVKFNGRARQKEFWYFNLFYFIGAIIIGGITGYINATTGEDKIDLVGNIYTAVMLLPSIAVGVRRMHDVNKSGWYYIIPIYSFILACTEGTQGENQYGQDPKGLEGSMITDNGLLDDIQ